MEVETLELPDMNVLESPGHPEQRTSAPACRDPRPRHWEVLTSMIGAPGRGWTMPGGSFGSKTEAERGTGGFCFFVFRGPLDPPGVTEIFPSKVALYW